MQRLYTEAIQATNQTNFFSHSSRTLPRMFRDDDYVRMLNQLYIAEKSAASLYHTLIPIHSRYLSRFYTAHHSSSLTLKHMIIYHQGSAEESGFQLTPEVSKALAKAIVSYSPKWLTIRATRKNCLTYEKYLLLKYKQVYQFAPNRDRFAIYALAIGTAQHIDQILVSFYNSFKS